MGDSEAWYPQKVGGCGWSRCPQSSDLNHVAQDAACSRFRGRWIVLKWPFLAICLPFLAQPVELEDKKGLCHGEVKAHVECRNRFPSFGCFAWVLGPFWAKKKAVFGQKMCSFGRVPPDLAPLLSFWLKTWIWQDHHLGSKMARLAKAPKRWDRAMAQTE